MNNFFISLRPNVANLRPIRFLIFKGYNIPIAFMHWSRELKVASHNYLSQFMKMFSLIAQYKELLYNYPFVV